MLESIFKKLDLVLYEPGKVIYSSNDIISSMFYILYGSVKIIRNVITSLASPKRKRYSPKKSPKKMHDKSRNYKSNDLDTILTILIYLNMKKLYQREMNMVLMKLILLEEKIQQKQILYVL